MEEAEKFGEVTKVVLYDKEPEGIVSVRFKTVEEAEAYKNKTHGRVFNSQKLEAWLADERPKFKKSNRDLESDDEDKHDQQKPEDLPNNTS